MDILGFLSVIGLWIYGKQRGINHAIRVGLSDAHERTKVQLDRLKTHYDMMLASKTVALLALSAFIQTVLLIVVMMSVGLSSDGPMHRPMLLLVLSVLFILAQVGYAFYMSGAIPRFLMDDGEPRRYPRFYQDDDGHFTDDDGRVLTYEDDVYNAPLSAGQTGTILNLNDEGLARRYYQDANGRWIDARTAQPLVYANGHAKRINPVGLSYRYYQDANGVWFDGTDGAQLQQAPATPEETLADQAIDHNETIGTNDRRVEHDLADMPMLDPDRPTHLKRHSLLKAGLLITCSMFILGLCVIWLGLLNGTSSNVPFGTDTLSYTLGDRWIVLIGGLYLLSGSFLATTCAWLVMGIYAKTVQAMEFIAGIVIEQGLVILPGITVANVASKFTGAQNFIDEMKQKAWVLGWFLESRAAFLIWFVPVLVLPIAGFAKFMIMLMLVQALADHLFSLRGGKHQIALKREKQAQWYSNHMAILFVLLAFVLCFDGLRNDLVFQAGNLLGYVQSFWIGDAQIPVLHSSDVKVFGFTILPGGFIAGLMALGVCLLAIGGFFFFGKIGQEAGSDGAGLGGRSFGRLFKVFSAALAVVAAVAFIILIAKIGGVNKIHMPKAHKEIPAAPSNAETLFAPTGIMLQWKDASDNETSFSIERKVFDRNSFAEVAQTKANEYSWIDTNAEPGVQYCYRVVAKNADGVSQPSSESCAYIKPSEKKARELVAPQNPQPSVPPTRTVRASVTDNEPETASCTPRLIALAKKRGIKTSCNLE